MTTALYRFYDLDKDLLYVGITSHMPTRLAQHGDTKPWWEKVHTVEVQHCESRDEALELERVAIQAERPRFNSHHAGAMIKRTYYVPPDLYDKALAKTVERGEDLADVIRRALLAYVEEGK